MAEIGLLGEDERVELLNGQLIEMMPIGPFHGGVVKRLSSAFHRLSEDRWITSVQDPVVIAPLHEPQPDIMLLRPQRSFYSDRHPEPRDVFLLLEVADSTLLVDRLEKLPVYARAAIPEVWIVNLPERLVEVYREPAGGEYSMVRKVRAGEPLAPTAFPDAAIDTTALLGSVGE